MQASQGGIRATLAFLPKPIIHAYSLSAAASISQIKMSLDELTKLNYERNSSPTNKKLRFKAMVRALVPV